MRGHNMFTLRNKKNYLWIILNTPSYLELCTYLPTLWNKKCIHEAKKKTTTKFDFEQNRHNVRNCNEKLQENINFAPTCLNEFGTCIAPPQSINLFIEYLYLFERDVEKPVCFIAQYRHNIYFQFHFPKIAVGFTYELYSEVALKIINGIWNKTTQV